MRLRTAVFGLAISMLQHNVHGQTITITEHNSACSASYTTSHRPTTTVISTATVNPIVFNDQTANSGTSFVLRLSSTSSSGTPMWLTPDGNVTLDGSFAGQFDIVNGQLMTTDGRYYSASSNTQDQAFAASKTLSLISTTFSITNDMLVWSNPAFTNDVAAFYSTTAGSANNAQVRVRLTGQMQSSNGSPVNLYAAPGQWSPLQHGCLKSFH